MQPPAALPGRRGSTRWSCAVRSRWWAWPLLVWGLAWGLVVPRRARAGDDDQATPIPLTVVDLPYNVRASGPSMHQSLDVTYALVRLPTWGILRGFDRMRNAEARLGLSLMTAYAVQGPLLLVGSWQHEEWHRAVMSQRGIASRNGVFYPSSWSNGLIAVDRVTDEDLARLKAEHPADTVRLMMAGLEAQGELALRIGDHAFLYGHRGRWRGPIYFSETLMFPAIQFNLLSELVYHVTCTGPGSDEVTDAENRQTLTVPSRDFTGLDCTAFAYDLHRPDEPYVGRGAHPYGEGIDRYRSWEDLDDRERRFVARQRGLTLLELANPHLYGIDGFALGRRRGPDRWVAQLGHSLTPFGYSIDARVGLRLGWLRGIFALRNGINAVGWFPTATARLLDLRLRRLPLGFDVEADAWLQPRRLRYRERTPAPGGRLATTAHWWLTRRATLDATVDGKTAGYVPGSVFLDRNLSLRLGLTARL